MIFQKSSTAQQGDSLLIFFVSIHKSIKRLSQKNVRIIAMQLHKCCEPFFRKARSVNAADTAHASPDRAWPSLAFYVKKTDSCRVLFVSHLKVIPKAFQSYSKGLKLGKWCHFWIVNLVLEALLTPAFPAREQRAKNESRCSLEFVLTHDCIRGTPYPSVLDF